jgi:hypothetical protein
MKRLVLALALLAGHAHAEWVQYDYSDSTVAYYDPATISKSGGVTMVWTVDALKPNAKARIQWQWLSIRSLMEFQCTTGKQRMAQGTAHDGEMAGGNIVFTKSGPSEWEYTAPGTIGAGLQTIVCGSSKRT